MPLANQLAAAGSLRRTPARAKKNVSPVKFLHTLEKSISPPAMTRPKGVKKKPAPKKTAPKAGKETASRGDTQGSTAGATSLGTSASDAVEEESSELGDPPLYEGRWTLWFGSKEVRCKQLTAEQYKPLSVADACEWASNSAEVQPEALVVYRTVLSASYNGAKKNQIFKADMETNGNTEFVDAMVKIVEWTDQGKAGVRLDIDFYGKLKGAGLPSMSTDKAKNPTEKQKQAAEPIVAEATAAGDYSIPLRTKWLCSNGGCANSQTAGGGACWYAKMNTPEYHLPLTQAGLLAWSKKIKDKELTVDKPDAEIVDQLHRTRKRKLSKVSSPKAKDKQSSSSTPSAKRHAVNVGPLNVFFGEHLARAIAEAVNPGQIKGTPARVKESVDREREKEDIASKMSAELIELAEEAEEGAGTEPSV